MFIRREVRRLVQERLRNGTERPRMVFARVAQAMDTVLQEEQRRVGIKIKLKMARVYATLGREAEKIGDNEQAVLNYLWAGKETLEAFSPLGNKKRSLMEKVRIFVHLLDAREYLEKAEEIIRNSEETRLVPMCLDKIKDTEEKLKQTIEQLKNE